ncbi:MAG: DAK2 domain-containing protein [Lachnospiraceae bacterium]|nr:DAK2 domain-containing protein [Lachnospiraceae bacterium]
MSIEKIDAKAFRQCFFSAANALNNKKEIINELNVFPVPDGDTGTNMTMTIMSAARELESLPENADMKAVCKVVSMGSLRGARGNSGVILSQILRGFTKGIIDYEELTLPVIASSFAKGVETAYKAVMKPKEGTILTVAKGMADKALELSRRSDLSLLVFGEQVLSYGEEVLSKTPDMLPVLKEAGVVDSGGQGLIEVMRGAVLAIQGKPVAPAEDGVAKGKSVSGAPKTSSPQGARREAVEQADIKFGYCTEFIVMADKPLDEKEETKFKKFLESIGDSIVCVAMDDMVKVHVHTNHPGLAFEEGLKYGALTSMKIDNMREEHHERLFRMENDGSYEEIEGSATGKVDNGGGRKGDSDGKKPVFGDEASLTGKNGASGKADFAGADEKAVSGASSKKMPYGFITVCAGKGLSQIFTELGVNCVISGGQTMNPSTQDILNAINSINAETIYILPNNKNIILAANQAGHLCEDKHIIVIPSSTIPQGIEALINFIPDHTPEENERDMRDSLSSIKTGELTYAVRDTEIDGHRIYQGDMMAIGDEGILATGKELEPTVFKMLEAMVEEDSELITIYYGDRVETEEAEALMEKIQEKYPELEVDIHEGDQPVYYYIISVE